MYIGDEWLNVLKDIFSVTNTAATHTIFSSLTKKLEKVFVTVL